MKILIVTARSLHRGPRMIREIDALKHSHQLIATGSSAPHDPVVDYISSSAFLYTHLEYTIGKILRIVAGNRVFLGKYPTTQYKINSLLRRTSPDVVIVHDAAYLPYFFPDHRRFKVVFNAHEYHPLELEGDQKWTKTWGEIYTHIYRTYLPKLDLLINVNQEIADKCEKEFGVRSLVIPNASKYYEPKAGGYHPSSPLRFIHHGASNPDRKLEVMIEAFQELGSGYELDLMLLGDGTDYLSRLQKMVEKIPNVSLIDPVSYVEIVPFISTYDMAVYSLAPLSFNNQMALPNKFFEFVQARLPMAIGPSPVMEKLVEKYDIGVVAEDFTAEALAHCIKSLQKSQIATYRTNLDIAAKELSMERFDKVLLENINRLK